MYILPTSVDNETVHENAVYWRKHTKSAHTHFPRAHLASYSFHIFKGLRIKRSQVKVQFNLKYFPQGLRQGKYEACWILKLFKLCDLYEKLIICSDLNLLL